jgi:hypothetical protein
MKKTGGQWFTGMEEPAFERPIQWEVKWWAPIPQQNEPPSAFTPAPVSEASRQVTENEAKQRLLAGDRIVFSMDGDEAWFADGDQAQCSDVVIDLRQKGYLTRRYDPECDRGFCWDEASPALRALAGGE